MPSFTPKEQLRRLDKLSCRFPGQITKLLSGQKYKGWINDLHSDDPPWLVEYLDNVLDTLQPNTRAYCICQRELETICGSWKILPSSLILSASLLSVSERPIATRGPYNVHEAFLDGSRVWVKRLRIYSMAGPRDVERDFFREVITWKRLVHPNIVPLLGATLIPFQSISVWMSGGELSEYLSSNPRADRLRLLSHVSDGLNYLHSRNVIHGDLKGPSIIIDATGLARLTDFGLSRMTSDPESHVPITDGHAVRWAAPEVLNMELPVTKASDVYSFAMVVVEAFTGRAPFYDSAPITVVVDVLSGCRPERPADPNLTDCLWNLTKQCWNLDPQRRPRITEVVLLLQTALVSRSRDRVSLDGSTLASFPRKGSIFGDSCYQPSHSTAVSDKARRFLRLLHCGLPPVKAADRDSSSLTLRGIKEED